MHELTRRDLLKTSAVATGAILGGANWPTALAEPLIEATAQPGLRLATFRFEVTPPEGHGLCGGWIKPVIAVDDPLEALGIVLLPADQKPIVICAVDWTGILNSAHVAWRTALADAAGTTPDRVAVQCVHQHNAPFACLDAEELVGQQLGLPHILDVSFFQQCLESARHAVSKSLDSARTVTHIATGQAAVEKVAGNRRILGPDGKVRSMRGSGSTDPEHKTLPEGVIDPQLKTVAFMDGEARVAALHYYACHPMSFYGDGRVSADFCGLARRKLQEADPTCLHIYFTGCAGNVAAGKYNDGKPETRPVLMGRIHDALTASMASLRAQAIGPLTWKTHEFLPPPDPQWDLAALSAQIFDATQAVVGRNRPAYTVAWLNRCRESGPPILLSALHINETSLLHLPAECFIEYQLRAQAFRPQRFVATAAYGDGGPWYIPTAESYPQGGYEVSVAWSGLQVDQLLTDGIEALLSG